MRFPELFIGQRFACNGRTYIKAGPLTATDEATGKTQLMRKSAEVKPLDGSAEVSIPAPGSISQAQRDAVLAAYRASLRQAIEHLAGGKAQLSVDEVLRLIAADPPQG